MGRTTIHNKRLNRFVFQVHPHGDDRWRLVKNYGVENEESRVLFDVTSAERALAWVMGHNRLD